MALRRRKPSGSLFVHIREMAIGGRSSGKDRKHKMLQHETWPIDKLIKYARNPRKNDHAVDRVAAAIREFGFRVPVVAKSDGTVVDGHLRLKAAKKLGLTEVPVVLADDMTDLQIKAFRLSVNKMAELAEWDDELLAIELHELNAADFDMALIGFDAGELSSAMNLDSLIEQDAPESSSKEIDPDDYKMGCMCPKCGFEFDDK